MRNMKKYTVYYRDLQSTVQEKVYSARNDVDAAACGVMLCERARAVAAASAGAELVERLGAFVALEIVANDKGGRVIWTNGILLSLP